MLKAKDIMTAEVHTLSPEDDLLTAAQLLLEKRINGAPVLEGEKLIGVITQSDLVTTQKRLRLPSIFTTLDGFIPVGSLSRFEKEMERIAAMTVREAMSEHVVSVPSDADLEVVAGLMVDDRMHTLPVVDDGVLVGVIGKEDVLRAIIAQKKG
jgi:CBS domain-containing protein